jgi:hypothetical protein
MTFGVDQGTDEGSDPQGLLEFVDGVYDKEGAVKRRGGFSVAATTTGRGLVAGGGTIGVVGSTGVTPYLPGLGLADIAASLPMSTASTIATFFSGRDMLYCSAAQFIGTGIGANPFVGSFVCVVSVEIDGTSAPLIYRVFELATGNLLHEQTVLSNGQHIRIVATISGVVVAWSQDTTGDSSIKAIGYTPALGALALPAGNTVVAQAHEDTPIDLASGSNKAYLAYVTFSGALTAVLELDVVGAAVGSPATYWQTDNNSPPMQVSIACPLSPTRYFVASLKDPAGTVFLGTVGSSGIDTGFTGWPIVSPALEAGAVLVQDKDTGHSQRFLWTGSIIDSVGGSALSLEGYLPASRAFPVAVDGTIRLAQVAFRPGERDDSFVGAFLVNPITATGTIPDVYGQLGFGDATYRTDTLTDYIQAGAVWDVARFSNNTSFVAPLLATLETDSVGTDLIRFRGRLAFGDMAPTTALSTQLNGTAYLASSLSRMFDGRILQTMAATGPGPEPEPVSPAGTGLQLTGTFSYVSVLEVTNSKGQIYLSAPSEPYTVSLSSQRSRVKVTNQLLGTDIQRVEGKLYRTTANNAEYHLLYQERLPVNDSYEFEDDVSDVTLQSRELLYTTGDVLASEPVPAFKHLWSHRNRLFGINAETPSEVWFTKEAADPVAPQWNTVLVKRVENSGGPLIGGASLGDKCALFQRTQILIFAGEGPDALGDNDSFSTPEIISHGVGAIDAESIVQTPAGIMFRSDEGLYLLGADLGVTFVGKPVLDSVRAMGTTVAAVFMPALHQCWFAGSASATILVFDTRYARWSTFTVPNASSVKGLIGFDQTCYVLTNVELLKYTASQPYDLAADGTTKTVPTLTVALPWFRGAGQGGMQRLWKVELGVEIITAPATQTITLQTYSRQEGRPTKASATPDNSYVWSTFTNAPSGINALTAHLKQQRCSQARVRIQMAQSVAAETESMRLTYVKMIFGVAAQQSKSPVRPTIS